MTLTDDELIAAGRGALELLDLDGRVAVSSEQWSEMRGEASVDFFGGDWSESVFVTDETTPTTAVERFVDQISEYISESPRFWGVAFPRCPGHSHPAVFFDAGAEVVALRCPWTGVEIRRVRV